MAESITVFEQAKNTYPEKNYNLILPKVSLSHLPQGTTFSFRIISIDLAKDTFPMQAGKFLISKDKLDEIASGAGLSTLDERRTDDRSHPHYCEYIVHVSVRDPDGLVRQGTGVKTIDLRETTSSGEPGKDWLSIFEETKRSKKNAGKTDDQIKAIMQGRLSGARKFITEICASKAKNRAVSNILNIRRSYTREELNKPFVIPKLILDPRDPENNRALRSQMTGCAALLYGPPSDDSPKIVEAQFTEDQKPVKQRVREIYQKALSQGMKPEQFKKLAREKIPDKQSLDYTQDDCDVLEESI